jgi:hypothetical protein
MPERSRYDTLLEEKAKDTHTLLPLRETYLRLTEVRWPLEVIFYLTACHDIVYLLEKLTPDHKVIRE